MDQEQEQTPEGSQPEVQPAVDTFQPTEVSEPVVATPVETFEPPVVSTPQVEEVPVNPFASPEVSEPAASPVPTEPAQPVSPFAAEPQVDPVPPVFATASAPTLPMKKSHKGLIIGLVVGFVVLLTLIGVAAYIWFTNIYVAKADYQKAADAYTILTETDTSIADTVSGSNVSPNDLNSKVDLFNTQAESLGTLKAVQKDATVKSAYDAFVPNYKEEVAMLHAVAELLTATDACKQGTSTVKLDTCIAGLRAVKDKGSAPVTAYANAFADYLQAPQKGPASSYTNAQTDFEKATKDLQAKVKDSSIVLRDAINNKLK